MPVGILKRLSELQIEVWLYLITAIVIKMAGLSMIID